MSVLVGSSAKDGGFELLSGKTKDYEIGICCFPAKHAAEGGRTKTGWIGIRIMCSSGLTCLSMDF